MVKQLSSQVIEQLRSHVSENSEAKFYRRVNCVFLWTQDHAKEWICSTYGVSIDALNKWIRILDIEGDVEALRAVKQTGGPRLLSAEQRALLNEALLKPPLQCGYEQPIWEGKLVVDYVLREFKVTVAVRTAQLWIKELGFTLQRPRPMAAEADPALRPFFLSNSKSTAKTPTQR